MSKPYALSQKTPRLAADVVVRPAHWRAALIVRAAYIKHAPFGAAAD